MNHTPYQFKIGAKCYKMSDITGEIVRSINTGDEDTLQFFGEFCRKEANLYDAPPSIPLTHIVFTFLSCVMEKNHYAYKQAYIRESVFKILKQIGYNTAIFSEKPTIAGIVKLRQ